MPLFTTELNRLADSIGASTLTIRLHTAIPSNASPTNGRLTAGGGTFETGQALTAGGISVAANGDITNNADITYGTTTEAAGTVAWWSAYRGNSPVGFGTLPSRVLGAGDTYKINAGTLDFNGSTS